MNIIKYSKRKKAYKTMIRDITIGQYIDLDSPVHKIDARVKLIAVLLFVVLLFTVDTVFGYLVITAFLAVTVKASKTGLRYILRGLRPIMYILIFTVIINILMTPGTSILEIPVFSFTLRITAEGIKAGGLMIIRLVYLVIGTSILTLTTSPLMLTDAIERLLSPLKIIKVPAHEIAMMMTIAIRFIPTLTEEADKIMKAQTARGADFESGSIIRRARAMIPLLVPLFVSAFRRADDLAVAMDARCYRGGSDRTRMKIMKLGIYDLYAAIIFLIMFVILILFKIAF